MVLWSRCHGTSDDTEIAGRWEFIETSQYRVHRGEKWEQTQKQLGIQKHRRQVQTGMHKISKSITHKRYKSKNYDAEKIKMCVKACVYKCVCVCVCVCACVCNKDGKSE